MFSIADEARRVAQAFERFAAQNHQPAVEEPANDFEKAVNEYADVKAMQAELAAQKKIIDAIEREQRDAIAESLRKFFGPNLTEGVNTYTLSNRRKLKLKHEVKREIAVSDVQAARDAYVKAAEVEAVPVAFDDLLRVKYELDKRKWKKLLAGSAAFKAFARCMVTKMSAPGIEVD
jgi:hypothetical protein